MFRRLTSSFGTRLELPSLFEVDDFALVSNQAARGIIEIKRSFDGDTEKFEDQLRRQQLCLLSEVRPNVLGVAVSHSKPLFDAEVDPRWLRLNEERWHHAPAMTRLLDGEGKPDPNGVWVFIYFLSQLARVERPRMWPI
jgi:hypothetical protein